MQNITKFETKSIKKVLIPIINKKIEKIEFDSELIDLTSVIQKLEGKNCEK